MIKVLIALFFVVGLIASIASGLYLWLPLALVCVVGVVSLKWL